MLQYFFPTIQSALRVPRQVNGEMANGRQWFKMVQQQTRNSYFLCCNIARGLKACNCNELRATRHCLGIHCPLDRRQKKGDRKKYFDKWTQITGCNRSEERGSGFGQVGQENVWSDNLDTSFILNAAASIPGPAVVFFIFCIFYSPRRLFVFLAQMKSTHSTRVEAKGNKWNISSEVRSALENCYKWSQITDLCRHRASCPSKEPNPLGAWSSGRGRGKGIGIGIGTGRYGPRVLRSGFWLFGREVAKAPPCCASFDAR